MSTKTDTQTTKQRVTDVLSRLRELADERKVTLKAEKFGITATNALGVYQKDLQALAKEIGHDERLAIQLFDSGIYEARILCSKIFPIESLTKTLMEHWVKTFENWEICDSFCMGLFAKSRFAVTKAQAWSSRKREFAKRAGFVVIAAYCLADKQAPNAVFEDFFSLIKREADDERVYVKKSVNWALRSIGKRNVDLNRSAIEVATELSLSENRTTGWIGKNALRELQSDSVKILNYPRETYGKGRRK